MMSGSSSGVDWCHDHERDPLAAGRCVSKNLYINDADEKRKRVEALVRIQLGDNRLLGTLASKGIKVISKPSKKRQSVKNMDCKCGVQKKSETTCVIKGMCVYIHDIILIRDSISSVHPSWNSSVPLQSDSVADCIDKVSRSIFWLFFCVFWLPTNPKAPFDG